MRNLLRVTPLLLLLPLGCSSGDGDGDGDIEADASPDAPAATRDVTGSIVTAHLTVSATVMVPRDLSAETIAAHVPDGTGDYQTIAGTGASDGTFEIADVPEGSYLVQIGEQYFETTSSALDLGGAALGRADSTFAFNPGTTLTFDVAGLNAFQGATIDVHSPNAGNSVAYDIATNLTPPLANDSTAITGVFDWSDATLPLLIDSDRGDVTYIVTLEGAPLAADTIGTMVTQFAELPLIKMIEGENVEVTATLVDAPADQSVSVSFNQADWTAAGAELGPADLRDCSPEISFYINMSDEFGDRSLIEIGGVRTDSAFAGTFNYANPFPADWKIAESANCATIGFVDPPANTALGLGSLRSTGAIGAYINDTKPRLGAVRAPQIDGTDLLVAQMTDATPTISWTAPTLGTPTVYTVSVRQLGQGARGTLVATLRTTNTSIDIPSGVLASGQRYFFEIGALRDNADPNAAPFRSTGFAQDNSRLPTAVLTVQ